MNCFFSPAQNLPVYTTVVYDSTITGYFFFTSFKLAFNGGVINTPFQVIADHTGDMIYYHPFQPVMMTDFKIQPNGKISYFKNSKYFIADSLFNLIDSISCIGYETDAHDLQILSNNHYLVIGTETDTMDLSSYHYFNHAGMPGSSSALVHSNVIQELDSNKNVVFEWHAKNHFAFSDVDPYFLFSPNNVDWTHCNAVEKDADGNILLSTRHLNEITKIDFTTGNILWRMGGKQNQFIFFNDSFAFRGQHDIRRIANGHITFFDNGKYTPPHRARGVEYVVDEVNKTATLAWQYFYAPNVYSQATGNTQRLDNGNTLVSFGFRLNSTIGFVLLDSLNNKRFELSFPDSSASYRAFYYPSLPWSLNRPQLNCYQQGTDFYLQTITPFSSYLWSTGATTVSVKITAPGNYYVFVPYGEGSIKSEIFAVQSTFNPCNLTLINETGDNKFALSVSSNPFSNSTTISFTLAESKNIALKIFDLNGRWVTTLAENNFNRGKHQMEFNTEKINAGIYFLKMLSKDFIETKKLLVIK